MRIRADERVAFEEILDEARRVNGIFAGVEGRAVAHDWLAQALYVALAQRHQHIVVGQLVRPNATPR